MADLPSFQTLKALIEQPDYYSDIAQGRVDNMCSALSDLYSLHFSQHGAENIILSTNEHNYLAVRTSDHGIVIFDPTFRQYFPDYGELYFLGSPQDLSAYVRTQDTELAEAFSSPKISRESPDFPEYPADTTAFVNPWRPTLLALQETSPVISSAQSSGTLSSAGKATGHSFL